MKTIKPLVQALALILTVSSSVVPVVAAEQGVMGRNYMTPRGEAASAIPEAYRRSFSTSRNEVVMMFKGDHWRSLTTRAAKGSLDQQMEFCARLTRSDYASGKIPFGFRYGVNGDGRIYLTRHSDYVMAPGRMVSMQ